MRRALNVGFALCIFYWVGTGIWFIWPIDPPMIELPGSTVTPQIVEKLGVITIARTLVVSREESVFVQRVLFRGDCAKSCEIIDMPSGNLTLPIGAYPSMSRDHILQRTVESGEWRAAFNIQWRDRLGRTHIVPMQELKFTVLP